MLVSITASGIRNCAGSTVQYMRDTSQTRPESRCSRNEGNLVD